MATKILDVAPWHTWGTTTATVMLALHAADVDISLARLAAIFTSAAAMPISEDVKKLVETVISDSWSFPDLRP